MSGRAGRGRGRGGPDRGDHSQSLPHRLAGAQRGSDRGHDASSRGGRGYDGASRGGGGGRGRVVEPIRLFSITETPVVEDVAVTQREDALLRITARDTSIKLPHRPAYGQQGSKLLVWTNYFRLERLSSTTLARYTITVKREGKDVAAGITKRVIQLLIEDNLRSSGIDAVSDLRTTLISRRSISDSALSYDVIYRAEGELTPEDDARHYDVTLEPSGVLNLGDLLDYSTSSSVGPTVSQNQELIQALNIAVGYASKTDPTTATVGRNGRVSTATNQPRFSLGAGLEALRSFVFSVRSATERVLINVQIKNLPFVAAGSLEALVGEFMRSGGNNSSLNPFLRRVSVEVTHIQRRGKSGNLIPRFKTIFSLATVRDGSGLKHPPRVSTNGAGAHNVKFWLDEESSSSGKKVIKEQAGSDKEVSKEQAGARKKSSKGQASTEATKDKKDRYISVYEFFRTHYNITIRDATLPVVNVGSLEKPAYLPLQVCEVREGQVARGEISPQQTAQMIKFAVRQPSANAQSIITHGHSLLRLERNDATVFNFKIEPKLLIVPGRRLPAPQVNYANNKTVPAFNGRWDLRGTQLLRGATLSNWHCLVITITGRSLIWDNSTAMQECLQSFIDVLKGMGMRCGPGPRPELIHVDAQNPGKVISGKLQQIAASPKGKPTVLLVVMPKDSAIYNSVKFGCDVEEGLLCQCVVDTQFAKKQAQYFANVGLKLNLKLGGINHSIPPASFGVISPDKTMFVGLDVTHPSPGSKSSAPSVAGIVSSIDRTLGQWPAAIRVQAGRKEMVTDLTELFQGQLQLWRSKNQTLPTNVILYRDGVSEGQYQVVLDEELPAIKKAFGTIYTPAEIKQGLPRLCIIVVGKRHHTRFYPTKVEDQDKTGNPKNGLVVDRGVTQHSNWDFFLQAHTALHGTAKPAHYYVIYDELLRKSYPGSSPASAADALERLTYGLCYLFGRCTSAVSVCPPAKYADLVCERARCYLSDVFNSSQSDTASNASGAVDAVAMASRVAIHTTVRDRMFYI